MSHLCAQRPTRILKATWMAPKAGDFLPLFPAPSHACPHAPHRSGTGLLPARSILPAASGVEMLKPLSHPKSPHRQQVVLTGPRSGWRWVPAGSPRRWPETGLRRRLHPGWTGNSLLPRPEWDGLLWRHKVPPSPSHSSHGLQNKTKGNGIGERITHALYIKSDKHELLRVTTLY